MREEFTWLNGCLFRLPKKNLIAPSVSRCQLSKFCRLMVCQIPANKAQGSGVRTNVMLCGAKERRLLLYARAITLRALFRYILPVYLEGACWCSDWQLWFGGVLWRHLVSRCFQFKVAKVVADINWCFTWIFLVCSALLFIGTGWWL